MSKCKNDVFMNKVGVKKLTKATEVDFTVYTDLPDCARINANKYRYGSSRGTYNRFDIPDNMLECNRQGCINTGTLMFDSTTIQNGAHAIYEYHNDTLDYLRVFSLLTFYTKNAKAVEVAISNDSSFDDSNVYTFENIQSGIRGFQVIVVDLNKTPDETTGQGWLYPEHEFFIKITITEARTSGTATGSAGISSIALFESLEDFESSDVVKIGCLSGIDGSWELEPAEETCFVTNEYDLSELNGFDKTITGKALTENYMRLHPLAGRGSNVLGFDVETVEVTVERGDTYGNLGKVVLHDFVAEECGFLSIGMADACKGGMLKRLVMPSLVDFDDEHYVVVKNDVSDREGVTIYFNKTLIDQKIIISYPKRVNVEEWVLDADNAGTTHVRMSYTKTQTDGTKWRFVFDNVMITSFPDSVTDEETEFEFTVSIRKDASGRFGRAYKII